MGEEDKGIEYMNALFNKMKPTIQDFVIGMATSFGEKYGKELIKAARAYDGDGKQRNAEIKHANDNATETAKSVTHLDVVTADKLLTQMHDLQTQTQWIEEKLKENNAALSIIQSSGNMGQGGYAADTVARKLQENKEMEESLRKMRQLIADISAELAKRHTIAQEGNNIALPQQEGTATSILNEIIKAIKANTEAENALKPLLAKLAEVLASTNAASHGGANAPYTGLSSIAPRPGVTILGIQKDDLKNQCDTFNSEVETTMKKTTEKGKILFKKLSTTLKEMKRMWKKCLKIGSERKKERNFENNFRVAFPFSPN